MPEFVIDRIREIMNENGITDISKVGLYGLTYKDDIDDMIVSIKDIEDTVEILANIISRSINIALGVE